MSSLRINSARWRRRHFSAALLSHPRVRLRSAPPRAGWQIGAMTSGETVEIVARRNPVEDQYMRSTSAADRSPERTARKAIRR